MSEEKTKTVLRIVEQYLSENGYDGLCCLEVGVECGCSLEDLMPCGGPSWQCTAWKKGEDEDE